MLLMMLSASAGYAFAQAPMAAVPQSAAQNSASNASQPIAITLEEAIRRAEANEPTFATALADNKVARLDRSIARAGLLPSAIYHNQALYTEPNGLENQAGQGAGAQPSPKFIANNAVHEYASQAVINEQLGLAQISRSAGPMPRRLWQQPNWKSRAADWLPAVSGLYFGLAAADNKLAVAELALTEAADFTKLTGERERAREAAHADAVKAQLQQQQRERELSDAKLAADKARLELGVLLFPDPRTPYTRQRARGSASGRARRCRAGRRQE